MHNPWYPSQWCFGNCKITIDSANGVNILNNALQTCCQETRVKTKKKKKHERCSQNYATYPWGVECTDLERRSSFKFTAAPLPRLSILLHLSRRRWRLLLRRLLLLLDLLPDPRQLGLASLQAAEGAELPKSTPLQRNRARPTSTTQHRERDVVNRTRQDREINRASTRTRTALHASQIFAVSVAHWTLKSRAHLVVYCAHVRVKENLRGFGQRSSCQWLQT